VIHEDLAHQIGGDPEEVPILPVRLRPANQAHVGGVDHVGGL